MRTTRRFRCGWLLAAMSAAVTLGTARAEDIFVAPGGNDRNPGTADKPLATLSHAMDRLKASRAAKIKPVNVLLRGGTYYLPETLVLSSEISGAKDAPVVIAAAPGETPVLSGGRKLELTWKPGKDGGMEAQTPPGLTIDQLWVNGKRQHMARYPNRVPRKNVFDRWDLKHGNEPGPDEDALSAQRIARWQNPAGGYLHAMHKSLWGDMHWLIKGKKADGTLDLVGGWQNNRPSPMHGTYRFVENIREELDAPGEWFHDAGANVLYFIPEPGTDLKTAVVEIVRLAHLIEFQGAREKPVQFVELRGLTFRHAARTFMDNKEPLNRSDWTIYRGGAVFFNGAADCTVADCAFDQVGGNTIFVSNWNRRIVVRGCLIDSSGANGIAFVGDPKAVRSPLLRYGPQNYQALDRAPGPLTDNFPADCLVEDCLITRTGRDEKQTAPVQISMSQDITVRHCSIYEAPRAAVNISEGNWGGHLIEFCDVFDTVLETGDHGSFNSWGRDRYWTPATEEADKQVAADPALPLLDAVKPVRIHNNRWRCDHGWAVDLDDGSTNYEISDNLLLFSGLKLREGFCRKVFNNIVIGDSMSVHCWYADSRDEIRHNIFSGPYKPVRMPKGKWGKTVDRNFFSSNERDAGAFSKFGCDENSVAGDPQFIDPAKGDYRVKEGSPALGIGFKNFPMDQFGVLKPELRRIARTPDLAPPTSRAPRSGKSAGNKAAGKETVWLQATARLVAGDALSAFGVSLDETGLQLLDVPAGSPLAKAGIRTDDLVLRINGQAVRAAEDLEKLQKAAGGKPLEIEFVRNQQHRKTRVNAYP